MTGRSLLCVSLAVGLVAPGAAMAQKLTKKALDMQNVPVPARPAPKPAAQPSTPTGPRLTLEEFTGVKLARIHDINKQQIAYLRRLIQLASPDDPNLPDYWFRLGELFTEQYRYFNNRARSLDEPIFRAEHDGDADSATQQKREQEGEAEKADQSLQKAVSQFVAAAKYPHYPRMDEVLFRLGHLLERGGRADQARVLFHRLLKEYPQSRHVPDAYLFFADELFAQGEMARAFDFYVKVTQFPQSGVYGFALYKKAWAQVNLGEFKAALGTFVDLIGQCQAGVIGQAQRGPLLKEARRDLVRTYARTPGADPDRALDFFRRVGGDEAPHMLQALAELYWDEGMAVASSRAYRKLMAFGPQSSLLCAWQGKVLRNTLSAGTEPEQVQELRRLGSAYRYLRQLGQAKTDVIAECRDKYRDSARELAFVLHKQAQRLKQLATFQLAAGAYRELLSAGEGAAETAAIDPSFYYAECLWQIASLVPGDSAGWREAAEQYTRVVHLDPKGRYVREAAYAAVLAWQNALYESDQDLHQIPRRG